MGKPQALATTDKARTIEVPTIASLNAQAVDAFEVAAGGRQQLLAVLDSHPALTKQDRQALLVLADPRFDSRRLSKVCGAVGITVGRLYQLYKDARMASAQLAAIEVVAGRTTAVATELLDAAFRRRLVCELCEGLGSRMHDGPDGPVSKECGACSGAGVVVEKPSTSDRKLAAEVAGLVSVSGGGVNVQVTANAQAANLVANDPTHLFSRMQEATDLILYGDPRSRGRHKSHVSRDTSVVDADLAGDGAGDPAGHVDAAGPAGD